MMEVISVGIAIIDVIHDVAAYPEEDSKIRSLTTRKCRGGNAANALVVCSQLGGHCRWLGMSTEDSDAAFVHEDLLSFGVDCSLASIEAEGSMPISVSLEVPWGEILVFILVVLPVHPFKSRDGVPHHHNSRNLVELSCEAFVKQHSLYRDEIQHDVSKPVWFHFEGRNLEEAGKMMLHVRESMSDAKFSVEIEALRNDSGSAMKLISLADYAFIPKDYLRKKLGFQSADQFFEAVMGNQWGSALTNEAKAFICPWGSEGVYYLDVPVPETHHLPATRLDKVVETIGAGDSCVGASLAGLSSGNVPLDVVLKTACEVASAKCSKQGFALSLEEQATWQKRF